MFPWLTGLSLKEKDSEEMKQTERQRLETGLSWGLEPQGAAAMTHSQLSGYCRQRQWGAFPELGMALCNPAC